MQYNFTIAMELILKTGLKNLKFGQSTEDAINAFGKPDREYQNSDDENEFILEWNKHKLRLTFYENENRKLGYIRTSHTEAHINGHVLINQEIDAAKQGFDKDFDWEADSYDFFQTHLNEEHWIVLNVEYNRITDIELGVPLKNEDEYAWPV